MGKKQQNKEKDKLSANKRNELNSLVDFILIKTKESTSCEKAKVSLNNFNESEFNQYLELNEALDRIKKIESEIKYPFKKNLDRDNEKIIENFCNWCTDRSAKFNKVCIKRIPGYDLGLIATSNLQQNDIFIEIPKQMIYSYDKIEKRLPNILKTIPLFENMSHIRLAFSLLLEKLNWSSSEWKPYLDILPEKYRTCLYFSPKDVQELKGTNALSSVLKQCKYIASQYAFLYKYIHRIQEEHPLVESLKRFFSYDLYCWAVSTVMTRQNLLPSDAGNLESVLIPLWDMANHMNGAVTTTYNEQLEQIESHCLKEFQNGEQILICYGNRSNEDFLVHNGFVFMQNINRDYSIRLSLSLADELHDDRIKLLNLLNIKSGDMFQISPTLSQQLIAFVRVFNMNKDQLNEWLLSENVDDLMNDSCKQDKHLEMKCLVFLKTRIQLLLKMFPTSLEEDQTLLANHLNHQTDHNEKLSAIKLMLIQYRILEKIALHNALKLLSEQC